MFELDSQKNYHLLVQTLLAGNVTAYLGAGLSRPDQPSWKDLHDAAQAAAGLTPAWPFIPEDAPIDFSIFRRKLDDSFIPVIRDQFGPLTPQNLDTYRLIDELQGISRVISTNIDEYLAALSEQSPIASGPNVGPAVYPEFRDRNARYVYLHGRASTARAPSDLVLDQRSYDEAYLPRNSRVKSLLVWELSGPALFIGCSMRDPDLVIVLRELNAPDDGEPRHPPQPYIILPADPTDAAIKHMAADISHNADFVSGPYLEEALRGEHGDDVRAQARDAMKATTEVITARFLERWNARVVWYEWDRQHRHFRDLLQQLRDNVGSVRIVPLFIEQVETLRRLGRLEYPTESDRQQVEGLVASDQRLLGHFWAAAMSPAWFDLLMPTGLVTTVYPDIHYPDGTMSPGAWPAAPFIERVAAEKPDVVRVVVMAMQDTANIRVHWILSGLIKYLSGEQLEEALGVVIRWDGGTDANVDTGA